MSISISLIFEKSLSMRDKILVMKNFILLLTRCRSKLKSFKINWEPFYDEIYKLLTSDEEAEDHYIGV